jgi:hypothetical protein
VGHIVTMADMEPRPAMPRVRQKQFGGVKADKKVSGVLNPGGDTAGIAEADVYYDNRL